MKGLIGFILLVGTVGSFEIGNIGIGQALIQSTIGLALLYTQTKRRG